MFKEKKLIQFLLLSIGLYFLWFGLYEFYLKNEGHLDQVITENITIVMTFFLKLTGFDVHYMNSYKLGETYVFLGQNKYPFLRVGASCNGLELLVLFTIFIICYPGSSKYKIPYIIVGNICIHILNIFRNYVLAILSIHKSEYFDLFHRYIFIFMVYGFVFWLWIFWSNKFSKLKKQDEQTN